MENKKIKNATVTIYDGITFKSKSEAKMYKLLQDQGITADYEKMTFTLSPRLRPSIPFYNRIGKEFVLDSKPIQPITYTPDFTFEYNGILVIIEIKGIENNSFYIKKNLFRKYLEELNRPVIFFEVRTQKELLEALNIMKKENNKVQQIRKLCLKLKEKDIPIANKFIEKRDWENLNDLVSSSIIKIEKKLSDSEEENESLILNSNLMTLYELDALIGEML